MTNPDTRLPLSSGQLDIWIAVAEHVSGFNREDSYVSLLSEVEQENYRSLRYPEHRFDYLLSRSLLRTSLAAYTGIPPEHLQFKRNEFGKPDIDASQLPADSILPRFNLSLTDGVVICAVNANADLGVDVEYHGHGRSMLDVADQYFSAMEIAELKRLPQAEQRKGFFRYWTLKESLIKAKGEGMSVPLDSFSFRTGDHVKTGVHTARLVNSPAAFVADIDQWDFRFFDLGLDYTAAVSMAAPIEKLCLRESIPLVGSVELDTGTDLFSHRHQDALSAAFC